MPRAVKSSELTENLRSRIALPERIEAFLSKYQLAVAGFALVISTPDQTVRTWLKAGKKAIPPGALVSLMTVLEESAEMRELLGVIRHRSKAARRKEKIRTAAGVRGGRPSSRKLAAIQGSQEFAEGPEDMWFTPDSEA